MRIDPKARIAGHRLIEIRNFLRDLESDGAEGAAQKHLGGSSALTSLLEALQNEGLVDWGADGYGGEYKEPRWVLTDKGNRLSIAKAIKPLTRDQADRIVADMLNRVMNIVHDDNHLFEVERLYLFGSYIQATADCGDIDVCLDRRPKAKFNAGSAKWPLSPDHQVHHKRILAADSPSLSNFVEELTYPQLKLRRAVRGGKRSISMHETHNLFDTDFPFLIAYEVAGVGPLAWERLKGKSPEYFDTDALAARIASAEG